MLNHGWIKIHRAIEDNPTVNKDLDHFRIWLHLLLSASHKPRTDYFKGKKIALLPGQLITGRKKIALKTSVQESKIYRVLFCFESEQQIEQQKSNTSTLITVINWERYQINEQEFEQPVNNERTTSEQPVNTIQELKNVKNEKNKKRPAMPALIVIPHLKNPEFEELWKNFIAHRAEIGKPMTNRSQNMQLKILEPFPLIQAIHEMKRSIAGGWQGIHPPKGSLAEAPMSAEEHMRLQGPKFRYVETN